MDDASNHRRSWMKVAVIIPCYNVVDHIGAALRSVHEQTHPDLEVVVVDDGSTDGTREWLQRRPEASTGAVTVLLQDRKGACAARNAGLRATSAPYVQFLDADDRLMPGKIAGQVALIRTERSPAIIAGGYQDRMEDGTTRDVLPLHGAPWMALIRTRLGTTSANLWERAAVEQAGGWDEGLTSSQDYDLAFRIMRSGAEVVTDARIATLVLKRTEGSISRMDPVGNWARYIALRVAIRDHLRAADPVLYAAEIGEAEQYMFRAMRVIARSDRNAAKGLLGLLGPGFRPRPGEALSRSYACLYRWFGFQTAEAAVRALGNLQRTFTS